MQKFNIPRKAKTRSSKPTLSKCNKKVSRFHFESFENRKLFMDSLFVQLKLSTLDDWLKVSRYQIIKNGGKRLILAYYDNDLKKLLSSIYPNHGWHFDSVKVNTKKIPNNKFETIEKQRVFMDSLFTTECQYLDDFLGFTKKKFYKLGAQSLLLYYYSDNRVLLLSSIYPNYPWFNIDKQSRTDLSISSNPEINFATHNGHHHHHHYRVMHSSNFQSIEVQHQFMEKLFRSLEYKTMDDFMGLTKKLIVKNGGRELLLHYDKYENHYRHHHNHKKNTESNFSNYKTLLLSSIYPNYPWNYSLFLYKNNYFKEMKHQIQFMEFLFKKFKFKSLDDFLKLRKSKLISNNAQTLLLIYSNDRKKLLQSIYPNYPWNFSQLKETYAIYFQNIDNQREFMQRLYTNLRLCSLDDWQHISRTAIVKNGGKKLLSFYNNDYETLLKNIYPHHHWNEDRFLLMKDIKLIDNQKEIMNFIFQKLHLTSIDDWVNVTRYQFLQNGGKQILLYYNNDIQRLLSSIYTERDWNFGGNHFKFKPNAKYRHSFEFYYSQIKLSIQKYNIREKKDWYRIPFKVPFHKLNIYSLLSVIYPLEKWKKKLFLSKGKKSKQRSLFLLIRSFYSKYLSIEGYRHPHFISMNNDHYLLEFDIFIPSLNLAIEYQGEQHYDDMPAAFGQIEAYFSRDLLKAKLANERSIRLICVPYWYDFSTFPSSIFSFLDNGKEH